MNLNELSKECYEMAKSKGFHDKPREIGTSLMLIVSELAEALEADRQNKRCTTGGVNTSLENIDSVHSKRIFEMNIKDTFNDEIADTFIRLFDLCGELGIDIETHIRLKMRYNIRREHKHGKEY